MYLNRCGAITKLHHAISQRAVTLVLNAGITSNLVFIRSQLDPSRTKIFNCAFNIRTKTARSHAAFAEIRVLRMFTALLNRNRVEIFWSSWILTH